MTMPEPIGFMFDVSPALSNLLITVATGFFGVVMAWIAFKTKTIGTAVEEQKKHIEKIVETTNGMHEARIAAEKEAALVKGVLEGRQQVRKELTEEPIRRDPAGDS